MYHDGSLVATNANITGTINATSGSFTGTVKASAGNFGVWDIGKSSYGAQNGIIADDGTYYVALSSIGVYATNSFAMPDVYKTWTAIVSSAGSSDRRLKHNISTIDVKMNSFYDKLEPKQFNFNADAHCGNPKLLHYGLIAQDVVSNLEDCNISNSSIVWDEEEYLGLIYQELITLNIWQIQKLKSEIVLLKTQLSNIEQSLSV